jgi:hypothetical protein
MLLSNRYSIAGESAVLPSFIHMLRTYPHTPLFAECDIARVL